LYDPRTHALKGAPLAHFGGATPPVYSSDGSMLAYVADSFPSAIVVRDTQTHAVLRTLRFDPFQQARLTEDTAHAKILFAPDGRTVYCAYRVFDFSRPASKAPEATYLVRWSLPTGRRLSTTRIDSGAVLAVRLDPDGARLVVVDARRVSVFGSRSVRRLSSVAITPAAVAPTAAATSPNDRTIAVGSRTGQMSFIDATTGDARLGTGIHSGPVTNVTYSPEGRAVASTGNDRRVIVWDPQTARSAEVLTAPAEQVQDVAFSLDGRTLYTSSAGGVVLTWDLTGDRRFGRRFVLGAGSPLARGCIADRSPARSISGWNHVRGPPWQVEDRPLLDPHASAASIVCDQT
jgi:WD40 repeat protein